MFITQHDLYRNIAKAMIKKKKKKHVYTFLNCVNNIGYRLQDSAAVISDGFSQTGVSVFLSLVCVQDEQAERLDSYWQKGTAIRAQQHASSHITPLLHYVLKSTTNRFSFPTSLCTSFLLFFLFFSHLTCLVSLLYIKKNNTSLSPSLTRSLNLVKGLSNATQWINANLTSGLQTLIFKGPPGKVLQKSSITVFQKERKLVRKL